MNSVVGCASVLLYSVPTFSGTSSFLLDEAFSALDEMTKMELHAWYLEIHKQLGLTTLIITHSIEEALNLSDRIYILKKSARPDCI